MLLTIKIREPDRGFSVRPEHKLYNVERNSEGKVIACYVGSNIPKLQGEIKSIVFSVFVEFERFVNGVKRARERGNHQFIETLEGKLDRAIYRVLSHEGREISFVSIQSEYYNNRVS